MSKKWAEAVDDYEICLEQEPNNKTFIEKLKDSRKQLLLSPEGLQRKEKDKMKRVVIEEESSSEGEDVDFGDSKDNKDSGKDEAKRVQQSNSQGDISETPNELIQELSTNKNKNEPSSNINVTPNVNRQNQKQKQDTENTPQSDTQIYKMSEDAEDVPKSTATVEDQRK